jgi:dTDP-L-rhamnose 4-epimerase
LLAMERSDGDYQAINIGSGRSVTVNAVAHLLAAGLGKRIAAEVTGRYREGDIRHCFADISLARKTLGYAPAVRFEDGLKELVTWLQSQTAADNVPEMQKQLAAHNLVR